SAANVPSLVAAPLCVAASTWLHSRPLALTRSCRAFTTSARQRQTAQTGPHRGNAKTPPRPQSNPQTAPVLHLKPTQLLTTAFTAVLLAVAWFRSQFQFYLASSLLLKSRGEAATAAEAIA